MAGVIKMVMAMRHEVLPRTLHAEQPSTKVDWSSGAVALLDQQREWSRNAQPRRAAISSFGISGTNAHVILQDPPVEISSPLSLRPSNGALHGTDSETMDEVLGGSVLPWVISGRGLDGLRGQAARLHEFLVDGEGVGVGDVGLSLAMRGVFEDRAVVLGEDLDGLLGGLDTLQSGDSSPDVVQGVPRDGDIGGGVAFLFTGQGAQRVGMGHELYERFGVFRDAFDEACGLLDEHLGCSLRDVVFGAEHVEPGLLDETLFTQTGLFALEVSLFRLLESFGVTPDYLIGHSIGELAAAHVAGALSLKDACVLVAARGRLMGELPSGGAMLAVQASEQEASESIAGQDRVALAAVNAPESVVLSGDEDAIEELERLWRGRGRMVKRLTVSHAFHSPRMDGMLAEFATVAQSLSFSEPTIPLVSNLTGQILTANELCTPDYWVRHARDTVRFADGIHTLLAHNTTSFLELGPEGILTAMIADCLQSQETSGPDTQRPVHDTSPLENVSAAPILRADRAEDQTLLKALAQLWVAGTNVDWKTTFNNTNTKQIGLPPYAFQRNHYWLQTPTTTNNPTTLGQTPTQHPMLLAAVGRIADD